MADFVRHYRRKDIIDTAGWCQRIQSSSLNSFCTVKMNLIENKSIGTADDVNKVYMAWIGKSGAGIDNSSAHIHAKNQTRSSPMIR